MLELDACASDCAIRSNKITWCCVSSATQAANRDWRSVKALIVSLAKRARSIGPFTNANNMELQIQKSIRACERASVHKIVASTIRIVLNHCYLWNSGA